MTKKRNNDMTSLFLPAIGMLSREAQGKIWRLIRADVQVCVATYFWEGRARRFVGGIVWDAVVVFEAGAYFVE